MSNYNRNTLTGDLAPVNAELEKIQNAIDDQLDRKPAQGEANQMEADLDANSNRIINVAQPQNANDAARLKDIQEATATGLPDQTGQAGNYLKTDGSVAQWNDIKSDLGTAAVADVTTSSVDTTAGRVTKVGDFGVGSSATSPAPNAPSDYNNATVSGFYRGNTNTATNFPSDAISGGTLVVHVFDSDDIQQIYYDRTDKIFSRRQNTGVWSNWLEILKTGDYGVGGLGEPLFTGDVDTLLTGSLSISIDPTATNIPTAAFGILSVKMWQDNATGLQEFTTIDTGGGTRKFYRTRTTSVWDNWVEVYQSDIFVVNSFGFLNNNVVIATGVATSTTSATFYFPLNKTTAPVISVSGTFTIDSPSGVQLATGINSGNIALSGNSSNRVARVTVASVSGLTAGDIVELRNADASSGITF